MLSIDVSGKNLDVKVEQVTATVQRALTQAITESFRGVLAVTPEDTGFLRASWYLSINGDPGDHPDPPSERLKALYDRGRTDRPYRRLPMTGARANVFDEKFVQEPSYPGPKPAPEFAARWGAGFDRSRPFAFRSHVIEFRNTASYATLVDDEVGFQIEAREAAERRMRGALRKMKSAPRRRAARK